MDKYKLLAFIILLCALSVKCQNVSMNPIDISYKTIDFSCYSDPHSGTILINNRDDLNKYSDCVFQDMDFDKYTYLGISGGCNGPKLPDVEFKIIQDFDQRTYFIEISIKYYETEPTRGSRIGIIYKLKYQKLISFLKLRDDYVVKYKYNQLYNQ